MIYSNLGIEETMLFDEQDVENSMDKIEIINFHQVFASLTI